MSSGVCTIVVPAHNEEAVIERLLDALRGQLTDHLLDIVVVCNGCTDRTSDIVRAHAADDPRIRLIELAEGSKTAAIRAGFAAAPQTAAMVAVVDADVVLSADAIEGLAKALDSRLPLIAAPMIDVDLTGCSRSVRRYYAVWMSEPYVAAGVIGAGVYAVNPAGFERIVAMPDVLGDDAWARARFARAERVTSAGTFTVYPARTLRPHVRRRARIVLGNRQLAAMRNASAREPAAASTQLAPPTTNVTPKPRIARAGSADQLTYWSIDKAADLLASWRSMRGRTTVWSTDATSRVASPTR
jgi:glycosyltransferase involved in cell wall biosynthesis